MGQIITITSGKGGVGKSTTVANLATAIAKEGKKVVAVDFDIGLRNLDMLLGLENRIVYDVVDVMEGNCKLSQALISDKNTSGLSFLPASQTKDKNILDIKKIEKLLDELKTIFDFVLIDSPAGIESGFEHSVYLADRALIITTPEVSAVRDADRVIGIIDAKSKKAKDGSDVEKHVVINRLKPALVEKGEMLSIEDVLQILSLPLIGVVPDDEKVVSATNKGIPVVLSDESLSGEAYRRIARRVLGEKVEFLDLRVKKGFGSFIKGLFR